MLIWYSPEGFADDDGFTGYRAKEIDDVKTFLASPDGPRSSQSYWLVPGTVEHLLDD